MQRLKLCFITFFTWGRERWRGRYKEGWTDTKRDGEKHRLYRCRHASLFFQRSGLCFKSFIGCITKARSNISG